MTDYIIQAAKAAGWSDWQIDNASTAERERLARFYAIAFKAGMERAAEICESNIAGINEERDWARSDCAEDIRAEAHAQNQPKTTHDGSVV